MTTIVFSSFKGGVGKTTVGILVANAIAATGKHVLVLDLDHQMNTTHYYLLGQPPANGKEIGRAIGDNNLVDGTVHSQINNVDIVPGSFHILDHGNKPPETIADLLFIVRDTYDACIIDCPPTLNNLVVGAWQAADHIVTPIRLDSFDLKGVQYFAACLRQNAPDADNHWSVVTNFYRPPRETEKDSLDLRCDEAFRRSVPSLSTIRIPQRKAIAKAIHDGQVISQAKASRAVYTAIVELASLVMDESIIPAEEYF